VHQYVGEKHATIPYKEDFTYATNLKYTVSL